MQELAFAHLWFNILELGPLDRDWFEVLTARTSANETSGSDQDELCANQEAHFKTPLDKAAVSSQPFSTPKVFRHSRTVSPETEDEQSFTAAQGNISFTFDCLLIHMIDLQCSNICLVKIWVCVFTALLWTSWYNLLVIRLNLKVLFLCDAS